MIKFENVTKIYSPSIIALDDASFEIKPKEFVSVVGRSGAGKTTLLKLILVEERPTDGRIFFDNRDINRVKKSQIPAIRRRIGTIFQDYKLLPSKTIYENIAYVLEVTGVPTEDINTQVPEILEIVGLSDRADNFPICLSQGERQRAAIARAIAHRPELVLADEPTGNLDPYNTSAIIKLLLKVHEMGATVILATHNKDIVNHLGKRVITLEKGKIIRDEEEGRFVL